MLLFLYQLSDEIRRSVKSPAVGELEITDSNRILFERR